uniref:Pentatricopeptide repeat-containing protein n=1 Tax=Kalanchoe fedtschenkoi TaxID=63787 RepID=A0A7N0VMW1_KALFE
MVGIRFRLFTELLVPKPSKCVLVRRHHFTDHSTTTTNLISRYFSLLHSSPTLKHLRHLHARLLRTCLYQHVILTSKLISVYSRLNSLLPHSLSLFLHMPTRNTYSWNILIGEFSRSHLPHKALQLFALMRVSSIAPDLFTLPLVLRASAASGSIKHGTSTHGLCFKMGADMSLFVGSALVFMYVTFDKLVDARNVFDRMPDRDSVLWTSMLAGYAQQEEPAAGLSLFRDMVEHRVELDGVVMVSLLLVCGHLGLLKQGKSVHGWCVRKCLFLGLSLGNALIDTYVKCAKLKYSHAVFDQMPERDVISYSAIILGYGLTNKVDMALSLFDSMLSQGIKPNDVTFLGVLSACAHGGLVPSARNYFTMMRENGVAPELKHYACMVDCLARAGLVQDAEELVQQMPIEADGAVLGALLSGCRLHGDVEVGERVAKKLIKLEPEKPGYYVLLCNIYAEAGRYDEAENLRKVMRDRCLSKSPAFSSI